MKKNWELKKLGEVLEIQNGYAFNSKLFTPQNGIPLIRIRDLKDGVSTETRFNGSYDKKFIVNAGDYLIGMDGEFGCYEWKGSSALLNQRVCRLQSFSSFLFPRFLFYTINGYLKAIEDVTAYTTVKHISSKQIQSISIPLPPLPEQKRIVSILDKSSAVINKAKENAEKNLKNACELFESYLESTFANSGEEWGKKPLGELCERITKGSSPKWQGISYVNEPGILFVTSENVGEYQILIEQPKYVEEKFNTKEKKSILQKGDVLTNIVGASIGRTAVFDKASVANINQAVCLIRCKRDQLNNFFLTYLLNSPIFKRILHDNEVDNARANLSLGFFSQLLVPTPPLSEQSKIVSALDLIRKEVHRLEFIYQRKLADLEELKKSILQKAFHGELA